MKKANEPAASLCIFLTRVIILISVLERGFVGHARTRSGPLPSTSLSFNQPEENHGYENRCGGSIKSPCLKKREKNEDDNFLQAY